MADAASRPRPLLARFLADEREAERERRDGAAPDTKAPDPVAETLADVRANLERLLTTTAPLARLAGTARAGGGTRTVASDSPPSGRRRRAGPRHPLVERSVLAYGLPEFAGEVREGLRAEAFAATLRERLLVHEPRLDPDSLEVRVEDAGDDRVRVLTGGLGFAIEAHLGSVAGARGTLRVRTVMHPFRAPEVESA